MKTRNMTRSTMLAKLVALMCAIVLVFTVTSVTAEAAAKKVNPPVKVTSVSTKATGETSAKISYKKASRAKGYQVQYSIKSTMKSAKTKKSTGTSVTLTGLKLNTKYYVRVRAYNTSAKGKVQYGQWSAKKTVRTYNHQYMTTKTTSNPTTKKVLIKAAYDEKVLVKEAYEETVVDTPAWDEEIIDVPEIKTLIKEAYDEQVLVKEAYDETVEVVDQEAYDETVTREYLVSAATGIWYETYADFKAAKLAGSEPLTVFYNLQEKTETIHHDAVTHTEVVHHEAEYKTVHHDAEYDITPAVTHTVHHEATYKTVTREAEYKTVHHEAEYKTVTVPGKTTTKTVCKHCHKTK